MRATLALLLVGCAAAQAQEPVPAGCPPRSAWPDGMACVPGGTFTIGFDGGRADERSPGEVRVDAFFLDVYEVTNARYRACIEAGRCGQHPRYVGFLGAEQPVVGVSFDSAVAFCASAGRRLPTDAEFERAARGIDGTTFPWGDERTDPCARANVRTRAGAGCGSDRTQPVGSRPAGHFGIYDLAGNVHEWVNDHYAPCLRGCARECGDACFGHNPRGPCGGDSSCAGYPLRSIRGGSWYWPLERARGAARRGADPANAAGHRFGFRCASTASTVP